MFRCIWRFAVFGLAILAADASVAAEKVGEAVLIRTTVTGDQGTLATRSPVHRDERIRSSSSGLGEFVFQDGTKFAVGANSSVVIDKFVFNGSKSFKNLTINAAKGSFRWISGGSPSSAYKINTPAGTVGIRGTVVDIFVGSDGKTAVVLLKGHARFCGSNGCKELTRRCDVIVATPGGGVADPERVSADTIAKLGARALPFISGQQRLSGRFRAGACKLSASLPDKLKNPAVPTRATTTPPTPNPPSPPGPSNPPDPPSPPSSPSKGHPNNGKGNGAGDGSPNGRGDKDR